MLLRCMRERLFRNFLFCRLCLLLGCRNLQLLTDLDLLGIGDVVDLHQLVRCDLEFLCNLVGTIPFDHGVFGKITGGHRSI